MAKEKSPAVKKEQPKFDFNTVLAETHVLSKSDRKAIAEARKAALPFFAAGATFLSACSEEQTEETYGDHWVHPGGGAFADEEVFRDAVRNNDAFAAAYGRLHLDHCNVLQGVLAGEDELCPDGWAKMIITPNGSFMAMAGTVLDDEKAFGYRYADVGEDGPFVIPLDEGASGEKKEAFQKEMADFLNDLAARAGLKV